jgi:glucose-6-phosphate 1-dehydrogenase
MIVSSIVQAPEVQVRPQATLPSAPAGPVDSFQHAENPTLVPLLHGSDKAVPAASVVVFGATGDLVSKRAVRDALADLSNRDVLNAKSDPIVLVSGKAETDGEYAASFKTGDSESKPISDAAFAKFKTAAGLDDPNAPLQVVDVNKPSDYSSLKAETDGKDALFYGALPPKLYGNFLKNLKDSGLTDETDGVHKRVILEKPLGTDSADAKKIEDEIHKDYKSDQVLLVDHFLGYPGSLNVLSLRSNPLIDEALNSKYVDHFDVKLQEQIKSNDRPYFRETGIVKDMVQNHAMQVLAEMAMEPPTDFQGQGLRQARADLLDHVKIDDSSVRRGQFDGFNDVAGGAPQGAGPTNAETYVNFNFKVDDARWQGVPFSMTVAKGVSQSRFGVDVHLHSLPQNLADKLGVPTDTPATLGVTVNGTPKVEVELKGQAPRTVELPIDPNVNVQPPYSRLISDALKGDQALFVDPHEAVKGWEIADEVAHNWGDDAHILHYKPGTSIADIAKAAA